MKEEILDEIMNSGASKYTRFSLKGKTLRQNRDDIWMFGALVDALRESVDFAYELERKNGGQDIQWDGPILTTARIISGCDNIRERLAEQDPEELNYTSKQPDAMNRILICAIQLGIEQGFRTLMKERYMRRMDIRNIKDAIELLSEKYAADSDEHHEVIGPAKQALGHLEKHIEDPGIML